MHCRPSHIFSLLAVAASIVAPRSFAVGADEKVLLAASADPGATVRVEVVVEAAGELKFKDRDALKSLPTAVTAKFAFDEKRLADDADGWRQSIRRYRTTEPTIRVDQTTIEPRLRDERNLVVLRATDAQPLAYSPLGPLNADEAELLQLPLESLLVNDLLPGREVAVGESWKTDDAVWCSLLNLDAVSKSEVSSTLAEAAGDAVRIEFKGLVQGALGGVTAEFEVVGRYKFDRTSDRITWLAVLLKEKRSIGHVEPGVEATTKLQMTIAPIAEPQDLTAAVLREFDLTSIPELLRIEHESKVGGYRLDYDRRWHVMTDANEVLSLRLVDRGELVAQCNIRPVTLPDPAKRPSLSQFQDDVRRSLGGNFGQFARVSESENSIGQTIFRAEAVGQVEELPIHWIYYLVQDPASARQVVFAFTVEEPLVERFAGLDTALISTVRFLEPAATAECSADAERR